MRHQIDDHPSDYKASPAEFKAGDKGMYEGHFSVFNNIDDGLDIMHTGAFQKTIQERGRRMKVFYAHDWEKLIGPPPDTLQEDSVGLFAAGRLTLDSFWGREVYALMKDNALTEGSIGYTPVQGKVEFDDSGVRHLYEVKLYEISPVPLGMNPLTSVEAVKALQRARGPQEKLEVFDLMTKSLLDTDVTNDNFDAWQAVVDDIAGRLAAFKSTSEAAAAEPQLHSALLERKLRMRAATLALSQLKNA